MGPIVRPKMSVRNYHYLLCNNPEEHSFQILPCPKSLYYYTLCQDSFMRNFGHLSFRLRSFELLLDGPGQLSWYSESLQAGWSRDCIPVGAKLSMPIQTGPEAHPAPVQCVLGKG